MAHDVASVAEYLAALPSDRRAAIARVRAAVNARLPRGYEERLQHGMISWVVPASRLSHTYNGQPLPLASLAAQKQHMALYLMCIYGDDTLRTWFEAAFRASGKALDMGKSCMRFTSVDDLPLDVIGEAIARVPVDAYIAQYEATRSQSVKPKPVATTAPGTGTGTGMGMKAATPGKAATAGKAAKAARATPKKAKPGNVAKAKPAKGSQVVRAKLPKATLAKPKRATRSSS
jgi:hypothetical protein